MSDNDPSDAALERGDNSDLTALQGFRGHGPKLSTVSRAINPRAQLMAEQEGQSAEPRAIFGNGYPPSDLSRAAGDPYAYAAPPLPPPPRPRDLHSTLPRGMPAVRMPPGMRQAPPPPPPMPAPPPGITDAEAWDSYTLAVLPVLMAQFPDHGASDLIPHAAMMADELLEERRRRFQ